MTGWILIVALVTGQMVVIETTEGTWPTQAACETEAPNAIAALGPPAAMWACVRDPDAETQTQEGSYA